MSHGRSVVAFHWPTLAFSYSLRSAGRLQRVVPREDGVGVVLDDVLDLVRVVRWDREDRVDVVDLGAADDRLRCRCG